MSEADRLVRLQIRLALVCVVIAVIGGMLAAVHYVLGMSQSFNELGLTLPRLRPLHTTFASVWIYGGGIAVVYHYLSRQAGGLSRGDITRFWFHTACWVGAGLGIFVTVSLGVFSGREYLGFHPLFSILLLAGWLAFAWTFLRRLRHGFFAQPIYVWFWTIGILFFVYTFVEGHAWLLPSVAENPVRDLQIQWKSCGTLVGSFNFLVYGTLIYVSERLSGDRSYAQSKVAFWLFGVGCLNSFTNYVHHTYHVPQTELAKWIAFVVSMLEGILLMRVVWDVRRMIAARGTADANAHPALRFFTATKWWTAAMVGSASRLSVPKLNTLVHGTTAVTGCGLSPAERSITVSDLSTSLSSWLRRRSRILSPVKVPCRSK